MQEHNLVLDLVYMFDEVTVKGLLHQLKQRLDSD